MIGIKIESRRVLRAGTTESEAQRIEKINGLDRQTIDKAIGGITALPERIRVPLGTYINIRRRERRIEREGAREALRA